MYPVDQTLGLGRARQPQEPEAGKNKGSKKVPNQGFPKVQVPFSDFSKVTKKVRTKNQSSKVRQVPEKVSPFAPFANYFWNFFFGIFFGTFELWLFGPIFFVTSEESENET